MFLSGQVLDKTIIGQVGANKRQLTDSGEFAEVLTVVSRTIKKYSDNKATLLYLIDEVEWIKNITNANAQNKWNNCIRRVVEIDDIGFIMAVGAEQTPAPTVPARDPPLRQKQPACPSETR